MHLGQPVLPVPAGITRASTTPKTGPPTAPNPAPPTPAEDGLPPGPAGPPRPRRDYQGLDHAEDRPADRPEPSPAEHPAERVQGDRPDECAEGGSEEDGIRRAEGRMAKNPNRPL